MSQFDVNGAFGGGGFVSSSQSTQTHDTGFSPAKNRDIQVLLPLTVKQISDSILTNEDKSNFIVDGVEVNSLRLIAMVSNKLDRVSEVVLTLDDGTGRMDCHRWMNDSSESKEMEEIEQGMYVRVHGQLKGFQGKKNLVAFSIRPVTDFNEIADHFIECIHVHVHNCRLQGGVHNQSHVTNSAMSTPVQNESGYQAPASNQFSGHQRVEDMILGFLQTPANLISRNMPLFSCNSCNSEFEDDAQQKAHYKSEWHRYNLKRKVAGVPGVTETLFVARQAQLAQDNNKLNQTPMLYSCALCGKGYRSSKAHAQHLKSRTHLMRASDGTEVGDTVIRPIQARTVNKAVPLKEPENVESEDSDSEWEDVDPNDEAFGSLAGLTVEEVGSDEEGSSFEMVEADELDPSCCFICDATHKSIENCMVHMHKHHGFFIPDVEYLKDPVGLLTYLGLKVKRDYMCLYCNDRCHPFSSLEAVRKHMVAKSHCRVRYGDGDDDEEAELEDFYDYSTSYVDEDGKQLVAASGDMPNTVEFGSGGAELIITRKTNTGSSVRTLGSREYLRYYRQKPRPTVIRDVALAAALASRYKSLGLVTVQSRDQMVRMKVLKQMNRTGVEAMRTKMGMKSNVIRNLPKNCTY